MSVAHGIVSSDTLEIAVRWVIASTGHQWSKSSCICIVGRAIRLGTRNSAQARNAGMVAKLLVISSLAQEHNQDNQKSQQGKSTNDGSDNNTNTAR
jgi:hypothetical protein